MESDLVLRLCAQRLCKNVVFGGFVNVTLKFRFLVFRNDIMVLLSREDIFSSRENLSLHEEELDINRLDYYQVSRNKQIKGVPF